MMLRHVVATAGWPWFGGVLLAALMLPPLRSALESSMSWHMLAQYPALMTVGALFAAGVPTTLRRRLAAWNTLGISGLTAVALILAVLMIPRVLDLALVDFRVEAAKVAALLFAGALLLPSWRVAGRVVQGFFLGNVLPMMVVVGALYQDAPMRLCNAYLLDDQRQLGQALVWTAGVLASLWLTQSFWRTRLLGANAAGTRPEGPQARWTTAIHRRNQAVPATRPESKGDRRASPAPHCPSTHPDF